MKKILTVLAAMSAALAAHASSQQVEEVVLNASFEISKCTHGVGPIDSSLNCDAEGSIGQNVVIPLDQNCDATGGNSCAMGYWSMLRLRDNFTFWADILVTKTTSTTKEVSYKFESSVGPVMNSLQPNIGTVYTKFAGMNDSVAFHGPWLNVSTAEGFLSYRSSLLLQPKFIVPDQR